MVPVSSIFITRVAVAKVASMVIVGIKLLNKV